MDIVEKFKKQVERIIETLKQEMKGVRASRANVALVEDVKVEYYDKQTPLQHLSSIHVVSPREIHVQIWDKEAVNKAVTAIESSGLGLSTSVEGNVVKVFLPELSKERREELTKYVKGIVEQYRIQIRHIRDEYNKEVDRRCETKELSEDDKFRFKEKIQEETKRVNEEMEKIFENKKQEISQ